MTQIFITRAELLPSGETTEDHQKLQREEAEIVEKDKKSKGSPHGGLFRGCFEFPVRVRIPAIQDLEDGVDRCPRCTWELEDGVCHSCGFHTSEMYPMSGSESPGLSLFGNEIAHQYLMDEGRNYSESPTVSVSEDSVYGDAGLGDGSGNITWQVTAPDRALNRAVSRRRRHARNGQNAYAHVHGLALPYSDVSSEVDMRDTDDYSVEDDDDAGSLDDFVVNDVEDGPSSIPNSPHSSHYDTDEVTSIMDNFRSYSSDENGTHTEDSAAPLDRRSPETRTIDLADDSDEGPVQRLGRRFHQSSRDSSRRSLSGEPDSSDSGIPSTQGITTRRAKQQATLRQQRDHSPNFSHPAIRELDPTSEGRRGVLIQLDSESEPLPPVQRLRRRRGMANRVISDDDDITTASITDIPLQRRQSSSGTATVGRISPNQSISTDRKAQIHNEESSPVIINSSPATSGGPALSSSLHHALTDSLDDGPHARRYRVTSSPSSARIRNRSRTHGRLLLRDSSRSPRHPNIQTSASRNSPPIYARSFRDQSQAETHETYHQNARARATRKAGREALKHQRRRREREQVALNVGASRPPTSTDRSDMVNMEGGVRFGIRDREQANRVVL